MLKGSHVYKILRNGPQSILNIKTDSSNLSLRYLALVSKFSTSERRFVLSRSAGRNGIRKEESRSVVASEEDITTWISKVDPYLPLELRSRTWLDNLEHFEGVRSVESLPEILTASNTAFPRGILTHIALVQKRWSAVLYICQAIFQSKSKTIRGVPNILKGSPWSALQAAGPLVDETFRDQHDQLLDVRLFKEPGDPLRDEPSLEYIAQTPFVEQDVASIGWNSTLGQIWRCLGHTMLAATRENSPLQVDMLGFALQAIASMHSHGIVSEAIYLFEGNDVPSTLRKAPFLHLMSSRIMTALSDIMWKKVEPDLMRDVAYVVAKHSHKGEASPIGDIGPRLRALKHEVWLELILWSCVHGNHFQEGVELINAMFQGSNSQHWSTVPWSRLQDILDTKLLEQDDSRKAQSWYHRLASSLEGYSEEAPMVDLETNTVSREVVARLCDGMLSGSANLNHQEWQLMRATVDCMKMLGISRTDEESNYKYSTLLRLVEDNSSTVSQLANERPEEFRKRWNHDPEMTLSEIQPTWHIQAEEDPQYSFLVKTISHHIDNGSITQALKSYDKLKLWSGNTSTDIASAESRSHDSGPPLVSQILDPKFLLPTNILATFIDFLTRMRMFDACNALLSPFRSVNAVIDLDMISGRSSSALSDALMRFASATSNHNLFSQISKTQQYNSNHITNDAIRGLLHHHIRQNSWQLVDEVLTSIAKTGDMQIVAEDIALVASRIVYLDLETKSKVPHQPLDILSKMLHGVYTPYNPPGDALDLAQPRQLNQMTRILASIPVNCFSSFSRDVVTSGRLSNPIMLPVPAFNILLETIVDISGVERGKSFLEEWCFTKARRSRRRKRHKDAGSKCFSPQLQTLRILIKPFTSAYRESYRKLDSVTHKGINIPDHQDAEPELLLPLYKAIVKSYYGDDCDSDQVSTVAWAMTVCKEFSHDEDATFATLLRPMNVVVKDPGELELASDREDTPRI